MPKDITDFILPKPEGNERKKETPIATGQTQRKKLRNKAWAILINQVWEVDPLTCIHCGGGYAKITADHPKSEEKFRKMVRDATCRIKAFPSKLFYGIGWACHP
jgi:hypothetical protein